MTAFVLALSLSACAPGTDGSPAQPAPPSAAATQGGPGSARATETPPPAVTGLPVPRDLGRAFEGLLDQRSRALMRGDRDLFLAGLDTRDPGFLSAQNGYFDNLLQLPLAKVGFTLDRASLVRSRDSYWVVVTSTMQLDGFDALPARTLHRFRFTRVVGGRYRLSSVYDRAWEGANGVQRQPWDLSAITVRSAPGVLGIFDDGSAPAAARLLRSVASGTNDVAARVPYSWDRTVVFYALSDPSFLEGLDNLPGEDPTGLDGVTFTVPAGPGDGRVVATRVAFNPSVLDSGGAVLDRLVRHELTHVAIAARADHAPTWLSEGLAEWVSVQAEAPSDRKVSDSALSEAEAGVKRMPATSTFNDSESDVHYAVAWWSVEYLAVTYGASAPWAVLDAFSSPHLDERDTIESLLTLSVDALARRGAKLMITTYDPELASTDGGTDSGTSGGTSGGTGGGTGGGSGDVTPSTSATPGDGFAPSG